MYQNIFSTLITELNNRFNEETMDSITMIYNVLNVNRLNPINEKDLESKLDVYKVFINFRNLLTK